jgi:hypothetical protein
MLFKAIFLLQYRLQGLYGVEEASTTGIDAANMADMCILAALTTSRLSRSPALK